MRLFMLSALAATAFSTGMTVKTPDANAVVYCAAGGLPRRLRRPTCRAGGSRRRAPGYGRQP